MDWHEWKSRLEFITPAGWCFRAFFVAEVAVCAWFFAQNLDLGLSVLMTSIGLFFVAYDLTQIIDDHLDGRRETVIGKNEAFWKTDGGARMKVSCIRYVYGREPFNVFVDGELYAKLYRSTDVLLHVKDREIRVELSRVENEPNKNIEMYEGMPTDLKIVFFNRDDSTQKIGIRRSDESDTSESDYRQFISRIISNDFSDLIMAITMTVLLSLKWLVTL